MSVYASSTHARALVAQRAVKDRHRFLVGTCSLHESNEVGVLEYNEESSQLEPVALYSHPDQIWALESSPQDAGLLVTSHQGLLPSGRSGVTLWRMPGQGVGGEGDGAGAGVGGGGDKVDLVPLTTLGTPQQDKETYAHNIKWHLSQDSILVAEDDAVSLYSLGAAGASASALGRIVLQPRGGGDQQAPPSNKEYLGTGAVAWAPSSSSSSAANSAAGAFGPSFFLLDARSMAVTTEVVNAHGGAIRDIEYNPHRAHMLLTCGEDRCAHFWDLRALKAPVKSLAGHSHWVSAAKFNPFHDQLVLTGGCDSMVNLWRVASCSSAPWGGGANDEAEEKTEGEAPDCKVRALDSHEESVYGLAWSQADAWIFASLSYDGRVICDQVPSTEKYKILL